MSEVTNLIITGLWSEKDIHKIEKLITKLDCGIHNIILRNQAELNCGTKAMESDVFLLAFNYFDLEEFVKGLKKIINESPFKDNTFPQLFVKKQHQNYFYEISLK